MSAAKKQRYIAMPWDSDSMQVVDVRASKKQRIMSVKDVYRFLYYVNLLEELAIAAKDKNDDLVKKSLNKLKNFEFLCVELAEKDHSKD